LAATAGYELADHAIKQAAAEKEAAQKVVARLIREAEEDADFVGDYHTKYAKHRGGQFKRAMDPAAATDGEDHAMAGGMPPGMEGGMPPGMGGGAPPEGGLPPEMGGGAPPPGPMGGGDPMGGGEGGAGGIDPAAAQELFNVLAQLGIPPEALLQAAQSAGGEGGAGGPPPEMGGGAPPEAGGGEGGGEEKPSEEPEEGGTEGGTKQAFINHMAQNLRRYAPDVISEVSKMAHATCHLQNQGKLRIVPVMPGTKQAQTRQAVSEYIREVCGFSS
jgi:hypothetical protein